MNLRLLLWLIALLPVAVAHGQSSRTNSANRLLYLDEVDPYYPHRDFAKLVTPQWVGEPGVEAVVILGIDDMRDHQKYETFLRPILNRLKKIDGRAPLSIMTCKVDPKEPHLQTWLKEGLSLECHSVDHPCPWFKFGFEKAKTTYDQCVDLLHQVPGSKPVAFRVPCCDSLNTPSPRFYAEIFAKVSQAVPQKEQVEANFLQIDTSVFNVFTSADAALPRELVLDEDGKERFKKYLPLDRAFVNYIEDYPYPYVIGSSGWQFPCVTPSDWQAQYLHKPNNPRTVQDWKAALDCTVVKKGVFCLVFHPHGWIKNDQVVELIDHAVARHGKKVKFLTFKEAMERLNRNLLANEPIRRPRSGGANGVRVLDLDNDGYLDVMINTLATRSTRVWQPKTQSWHSGPLPLASSGAFAASETTLMRPFGVIQADGKASLMHLDGLRFAGLHFDGKTWTSFNEPTTLAESISLNKILRMLAVDIDGDGRSELIVWGKNLGKVFSWSENDRKLKELPFALPSGVGRADPKKTDWAVRFVDLNGDGKLDLIHSDELEYSVHLFSDVQNGWSKQAVGGNRTREPESDGRAAHLPPIMRNGTHNGFFVHSGHLWWANEDTVLLKNHVDRRAFAVLLPKK